MQRKEEYFKKIKDNYGVGRRDCQPVYGQISKYGTLRESVVKCSGEKRRDFD